MPLKMITALAHGGHAVVAVGHAEAFEMITMTPQEAREFAEKLLSVADKADVQRATGQLDLIN
jgi:protein-L-isoaspartate O-methyltransferase